MNDLPSRHHPESSRRLGLLFAVAVLAVGSRWLNTAPAEATDTRVDAQPAPAPAPVADETPLRLADVTTVRAPQRQSVRLGPPTAEQRPGAQVPSVRPISAALCHALDERMKALDRQAAGKLPRHELRKLRAERQRARELQQGLRCRAGGDRYWF
jgi:hypothetical protein